MENKKGTFVSYQMAEAIKLLDEYDISNINERKLAEEKLQQLKSRWLTQDEIPSYGMKIGDKIAGMQELTIDEVSKFSNDVKSSDTYSTECIGNMQYCLIKDEKGNIDFDFSYLKQIADLARTNGKKMVIDSAVVFGDRFPENMANMSKEEIENAISIYTKKLTIEFGDCIGRIDVLNSVFQREDVFDRTGTITSEQFWINAFGNNYASKVLGIVKENCQKQNIDLCWNEFYITNERTPQKQQDFIETISKTSDLDVVGLQDNFRADSSREYIQSSLERVSDVCRKTGKKLSITELSCKVGRQDIEVLNEAKQNGDYSEKVNELNNRISGVLQTVNDFSEKNKDVVSSVESRYSDRYDCNHRECEQYGHNIHTNPRQDNSIKQRDVLKSGIEATEISTRTGEIQYQTKTINEVHRDRQMGEQSHEKTRSYSSNSNMQK